MAYFLSWIRSFFEPSIPKRLAALEAGQQEISRRLSSHYWKLTEIAEGDSPADLRAIADELKAMRWAIEDLKKTMLAPLEGVL